MRTKKRERLTNEQKSSIEEGGARGDSVTDTGDERLSGFFDELGKGASEDGLRVGLLLVPDFRTHFARRKRVVVLMTIIVGHDGSVFGAGGRAVGVPHKVEDALAWLETSCWPWNGVSRTRKSGSADEVTLKGRLHQNVISRHFENHKIVSNGLPRLLGGVHFEDTTAPSNIPSIRAL